MCLLFHETKHLVKPLRQKSGTAERYPLCKIEEKKPKVHLSIKMNKNLFVET